MSIDVRMLSSVMAGVVLSIDIGMVSSVDIRGNRLLGSVFCFLLFFMTCKNSKTNISTKLMKTN